jgi:DNA-binding NtrC family response regulator
MKMKPISLDQLKDFVKGGGTWEDLQKALLIAALDLHEGNRTYVAKAIGVSIRTIRNKIKTFDLGEGEHAKTQGK